MGINGKAPEAEGLLDLCRESGDLAARDRLVSDLTVAAGAGEHLVYWKGATPSNRNTAVVGLIRSPDGDAVCRAAPVQHH